MSVTDNHRSRSLAYILRHDKTTPFEPAGWVETEYLVRVKDFTAEEIREIVANDKKCRYELTGDGCRVRALYGHSVNVDLCLDGKEPPRLLYHGTSLKSLSRISDVGLLPMSRSFVHLTDSREMAETVGARHGCPVVAEVDAAAMYSAGYTFFNPTDHIWLVSAVPMEFLCIKS